MLGALLCVAGSGPTLSQGRAPGARGPVEVGVVTLHPQAVPITSELPGRASASKTAEIRPQVGGIVDQVAFTEGSVVVQGALLYQLRDDGYQAAVAVVQAQLTKAQAAVPTAQAKVTRYAQLTTSVSQSDLDDAKVALQQANADVAVAQAQLQTAQITLGTTKIVAPIAGIIGVSSVNQGALVAAGQTTALTTIRQIDPMYLDLSESSINLLKLRASFQSGNLKGNGAAPKVHLTLEDGTAYDQVGQLQLADILVSESTGTFSLRATIPNPQRMLLPGMYVRATIDLGTEPNGFLVPQRAVTRNALGDAQAYFVVDGKAKLTVLTADRAIGNDWLVTSGVKDGDRLVVDGLQKITDGAAITPLDVSIDKNGVILQTIPDATTPAATAGKAQ